MRRLLLLLLLSPLAATADNGGWTLHARDTARYTPATAANGHLGAVVSRRPMQIEQVIVGSAYNRATATAVSSIRTGIVPIGLHVAVDGVPIDPERETDGWQQRIDLRRAVHETSFTTPAAEITCRIRALRNLPYALMAEVTVRARRDAAFTFENRHALPADLTDTLCINRTVWGEGGPYRLTRSEGAYNGGADRMVAASVFLGPATEGQKQADRIERTLRKGEQLSFAVAGILCTTADTSDPWSEAERQAIYALREGAPALIAAHERCWEELWQGDIRIGGDPAAQRGIRFALYNLYASIRAGSGRSIPPMGLTATGYNGHIFWDAETWMFPPLAVLHPELAREMLDYRIDRLPAARRRAYAHGYRGTMFPWESDDRGEESTPSFALTGPLEHHITADVAIAAWLYYCATQDRTWLCERGYCLLEGAAQFIASRVTRNDDGSYSIRNVVGADEYANGVDDNAFTNGSARRALEHAVAAAQLCGRQPDPRWAEIAAGLRILRFADGTTREHATYAGEMIKQADANLLGWPLGLITSREALLRDLSYYAGRIDPQNGPAMSYSVFAIQYARLGMAGKAAEMFDRACRPNLRPPFGVFAETATSDNPYFVTGAGGLLQAVLFGFGGLEITPEGIVQHETVLPPAWRSLTIRRPAHEQSAPKSSAQGWSVQKSPAQERPNGQE